VLTLCTEVKVHKFPETRDEDVLFTQSKSDVMSKLKILSLAMHILRMLMMACAFNVLLASLHADDLLNVVLLKAPDQLLYCFHG
jgi:hypothetical protein